MGQIHFNNKYNINNKYIFDKTQLQPIPEFAGRLELVVNKPIYNIY